MNTVRTLPLLGIAVLLGILTACGSSVGLNGGVVGGACDHDDECAETCVEGGDFPDGTCTVECNDNDDCPVGTFCIDKEGGICLLSCRDDRDCRDGYDCDEKKTEDDEGDEDVCIK